MNRIESVDELVETLKSSAPNDYVAIANRLNIPAADFMQYTHWKEKGYTRNCIERTAEFELLLLCWNPGDGTPIHCHGQQRCWVFQVSGSLEEVIYTEKTQNGFIASLNKEVKAGDVCYMDDSMGYHTLRNNSDSKSISLHLYAKPIDSCTYFDKNANQFVGKDMFYHSYKGELVTIPTS